MIPEINAEQLLERYDSFLIDAYGVLVHRAGSYPGANEFIARLIEAGKDFRVVTNDASRLPETTTKSYAGRGVSITADRVLASGMLLRPWVEERRLHGATAVVLGPEDSKTYASDAGLQVVDFGQPCDVVVIGDEFGYPFFDAMDKTLSQVCRQIGEGHDVALVVPNPDHIYPKSGSELGFASGAVAVMFEAGLRAKFPNQEFCFERLGKPFPTLYQMAMRLMDGDMVMIGDQLETDIRGAVALGLDAVLVTHGVSRDAYASDVRPTYTMRGFDATR